MYSIATPLFKNEKNLPMLLSFIFSIGVLCCIKICNNVFVRIFILCNICLFFGFSGKNDESSRLENSTWTDVNVSFVPLLLVLCFLINLFNSYSSALSLILMFMFFIQVADSVAKYCILLHIPEESTDAANFSAICILKLNDE